MDCLNPHGLRGLRLCPADSTASHYFSRCSDLLSTLENLLMWKPFPGPSRRFGGVPPQHRFVNATVIDFSFFFKRHMTSAPPSRANKWLSSSVGTQSAEVIPKSIIHYTWRDQTVSGSEHGFSCHTHTTAAAGWNKIIETRPWDHPAIFQVTGWKVRWECCCSTQSQQKQWISEWGRGRQGAALWRGVISQSAQFKLNKTLLKNALRSGEEVDVTSGARGLKIQHVCEEAWKEDAPALFLIHLRA